jgi:hypothetical protein
MDRKVLPLMPVVDADVAKPIKRPKTIPAHRLWLLAVMIHPLKVDRAAPLAPYMDRAANGAPSDATKDQLLFFPWGTRP